MTTGTNQSLPSMKKEMAGDIPIHLTLGNTTLSLRATGEWELDNAALQQMKEYVQRLEKRNDALEVENAALEDKYLRIMEEWHMEKFKCQLLVEMLAVSSLDEESTRIQAEQEKARAIRLKADIVALLEQARIEGLDMCKLNVALDVEP
ncbi:unnamed protein product [Peronospora belbahrii]|uniref:Uncharacterized protein n=1 Tax=Peronospora belbahrii TaxID=622444 RepID=A0AAU9LFA8_9STRA|nr:unnamed protein product [Peronospora belbahrii]